MRAAAMVTSSLVLGLGASPAHAAPPTRGDDIVVVEPQPRTARRAGTPDRLFLNRCAQGCAIRTGGNDAYEDRSTIPTGDSTLSPFSLGDEAWTAMLACVRATYAPYGVDVVDVEPTPGDAHVEIMVAGRPDEIGQDATTLGIAPLTSDCSPQVGVIGFAFANIHAAGNPADLCATVAHEAGHVYGLDHAFECKDPMTYLTSCEGKVFLNLELPCGEFEGTRPCKCSGLQSSHERLTAALDPGVVPQAGAVTIPYPTDGLVVPRATTVFVETDEPRTAIRVELWINGRRRAEQAVAIDDRLFELAIPADVSDGVLDLEARVVSDLGQVGVATVRVTQGVGCDLAEGCAAGEACDAAGRCVPALGAAALGASCADDLDCASQRCDDRLGACTVACVPAVEGQCPDEYSCTPAPGGVARLCYPTALLDTGGCCQAGPRQGPPWVAALLVAVGLGVGRRRRR
ncbi:MAG: MYXO-CTERM sorting domain-containing protein [Kofleriaceae bacterium]